MGEPVEGCADRFERVGECGDSDGELEAFAGGGGEPGHSADELTDGGEGLAQLVEHGDQFAVAVGVGGAGGEELVDLARVERRHRVGATE